MSNKSRGGGKHKPSPKELLQELESIKASLSGEASSDPTADGLDNNDENDTEKGRLKASDQEEVKTHESKTSEQDSSVNPLPGQQSLFDAERKEESPKEERGAKLDLDNDAVSSTTLENPFLPQHIKERLEREKSLYQREIDAAVKIPGLNPYAEKAPVEESLIDELVKMYLPQIEEELRRRLAESLKNIEKE